MCKKCLFWGMTSLYQSCKNIIDFEQKKNNIEILAMISRDKLCKKIDGIEVIDKSEIKNYKFDYLVIFAQAFNTIKNEALLLGIPNDKIINGKVFKINCFDFIKYTSLIENPVSIISEDCFGGSLYNFLNLKFSSPFINFYCKQKYFELLNNFEKYMNTPIIMERAGNVKENLYPIAKFKNSDIFFYLNHYIHFDDFLQKWERRKARINYNKMLVKMTIANDEEAELFNAIPFKNKVGFYFKKTKYNSIVYVPTYINRLPSIYNEYQGAYDFPTYVRNISTLSNYVNIFNMLTNEEDFVRCI